MFKKLPWDWIYLLTALGVGFFVLPATFPGMRNPVFWVWNGWGIFFTAAIGLWQFLHIYISAVARGLYPLRNTLALALFLPALILTFALSGWAAGLLAIIIGPAVGVIFARLILPRP